MKLLILILIVVGLMTLVTLAKTRERYENTCGLGSVLNDQFNEIDDLYDSYGRKRSHVARICDWQNPSMDWGLVRKQEREQQLAQISYANGLDYHTRMHTDHCNVETARNFPW